MKKEELQKMAKEHFAANTKEPKCYATSDGNVWMAKDKSFADKHATSLNETAIEFTRDAKETIAEDAKQETDFVGNGNGVPMLNETPVKKAKK